MAGAKGSLGVLGVLGAGECATWNSCLVLGGDDQNQGSLPGVAPVGSPRSSRQTQSSPRNSPVPATYSAMPEVRR